MRRGIEITVVDPLVAKKQTAQFITLFFVLINAVLTVILIFNILNPPLGSYSAAYSVAIFEVITLVFGVWAIRSTVKAYLEHKRMREGVRRVPVYPEVIEYVLEPPDECSECGASLNAESVDWVGPRSVKCPYCANTMEVVRKKALKE